MDMNLGKLPEVVRDRVPVCFHPWGPRIGHDWVTEQHISLFPVSESILIL